MQTIFRLPWSTEPSSDEALAEKMYLHKPRPTKPRVEIPQLNNIKRKRTASPSASPKNPSHVKKLKSERNGAVQPSSVPAKGVDAVADFRPHVFSAAGDKPVKQDRTGGNVSTFQLWKEKEPSTPGVTTASISSLAPTPTTADVPTGSAFDPYTITQTTMADPDSNLNRLRAIIEAHINLEILHKHNELRLIDQELAKCQVSLEQLRRCELMPYPGTTGPSHGVTQGTGKSLKAPAGYTEPQYPAPYGVTDGPYARHYATWLLQDPSFDPWRANCSSHVGTPMTMTTRNSRGNRTSLFDLHATHQVARTSRTSTGNRQDPGTPSGRDPMIMKRQADGEWVRLRCSVCHRSNFNNIQGFLNHCRIAHHQDYKSHEAAAIACGEVVQVDEAAMAASELAAVPPVLAAAPTPRVNSMPLPTATPRSAVEFFPLTTPVEQPHVNPLILQGPNHKPLERVVDLTSTGSPKPVIVRSSMKGGIKGQLAPHLSALMQRRGMPTEGLTTFMVDAKKKVDLSVYDVHSDSEHDHHEGNKSKKSKQKKPKSNSQHRAQSTPNAAHPASAKAVGRQAPTFAVSMPPPPATGIGFHPSVFQHVVDTPTDELDVEMELSPGTAPGLVSDHEDDFDDDDRSANGSHHHHDINMEDVEIRDASDGERDDRKPPSCGGQVCSRQAAGAGIC